MGYTSGKVVAPPVDTGGGDLSPSEFDFDDLPFVIGVTIEDSRIALGGTASAFFAMDINGVMYNADKSKEITQPGQEWSDLLSIGSYPDGIRLSAKVSQRLSVRLIPSATQKLYSDKFVVNSDDYLHGNGAVGTDGSFYFNIYAQE